MAVRTSLRPSQITERLLAASTAADVEEIIEAIPNKRWLPFGGKRGNWAQINAVSEPSDAIVERVTNAMDAVIEREVGVTGRREFSSPREAVEALFGVPGGRIANLQDDIRRRTLARQIVVSARESGVAKKPTVVVTDDGVGQHPDGFPTTLLSLNEENKRSSFYLMGAYGWGGASSLQFAKYTIFLSRRDQRLRSNGQTDEVGWSIVRYNALDEDMSAKHGLYEYLAIEEEGALRIPRFNPSQLPKQCQNWTGTICTCIEYELSRFSDAVTRANHSFWVLFNAVLFDPILPFLIREERPRYLHLNPTASGEGIVVNGSAARLGWDARKKEASRRVDYQSSWSAPIEGAGSATVRYFVLHEKGDAKKDWEPIETYVNPEQAVTITHNGQRQGSWRRELFNQLGLLSLAKFMIVHVDCDGLSWKAKRDLFVTTRDRLKDNPLTGQLRTAVATAVRSDRALVALDRKRKEDALSRRSAQHAEKIRQLLEKAIEAQRQGDEVLYRKLLSNNPDLPIYTDQALVKPEPRDDDGEENEGRGAIGLEYPERPTEIRILNPIVQIPAGGKAVIRIFVNAKDGYISPVGGVGRFGGLVTRAGDQFKVVGFSELRDGHMRCTVSAEAAQVGDRGRIVFTVTTPGDPPLADEADLIAVEPPQARVKATKKTKPGSQQGPRVEEIHRVDWDRFDLNAARVARVEHNSPAAGQTTFYVNWDYPPLDEKLMAEKKASVDELVPYKRKFCAAMAYSAWMQDSELGGETENGMSQEERDAELRRAARMFLFSEFLKTREV